MADPAPAPPPDDKSAIPISSARSVRAFNIQVTRLNWDRQLFTDIYHSLLTLSWSRFFLLLIGLYFVGNAVFAAGYWLDSESLDGARKGSYLDAFFFSVQTMATIGYGKMTPRSGFANALVTLEALVGMLGTAMATGLMFAKFARPSARVMFSRNIIIAKRNGKLAMFVRMANARANQIMEAQIRLVMLRDEITAEGEQLRRLIDLPLVRNATPTFIMSFLAQHDLDEKSPLYGLTREDLVAMRAQFMISLSGTDETFSQTVHARQSYFVEDLVWDKRFVDMMSRGNDGNMIIDYAKFDQLRD